MLVEGPEAYTTAKTAFDKENIPDQVARVRELFIFIVCRVSMKNLIIILSKFRYQIGISNLVSILTSEFRFCFWFRNRNFDYDTGISIPTLEFDVNVKIFMHLLLK
jgi:hypothetical protein